jgi:hypothetical protein
MAFTVEDGSGVTGANSYVTVAEAATYHLDRGNAAWAGAASDTVRQGALVRATDYIEQTYGDDWKGEPVATDQALSWPRCGLCGVDTDEIPDRLKQAVCLLALEALSADLNPVLDRAIKRERVEGAVETEFMDSAKPGKARPAISGLLCPYLFGSALNGRVVRV